jgi:hypothetical protein
MFAMSLSHLEPAKKVLRYRRDGTEKGDSVMECLSVVYRNPVNTGEPCAPSANLQLSPVSWKQAGRSQAATHKLPRTPSGPRAKTKRVYTGKSRPRGERRDGGRSGGATKRSSMALTPRLSYAPSRLDSRAAAS